jgi:hypothetical protein
VSTLTAMVRQIHLVSGPPTGDDDATSAEEDLARRMGQLQANALGLTAPWAVREAAVAAAEAAGLGEPAPDVSDLAERLGEVDGKEHEDDAVAERVDHAAELAAAAVATMIQIPGIGDSEVVQVIREYLSGLIEGSPLKDVFAAWATRLTSRTAGQSPPDAGQLVVPDPDQLEAAASTELATERDSAGLSDSAGTDPGTQTEPAIAAAVYLANQARLVAEGSTSCYECVPSPGSPDQPAEPDQDHPQEPPDEPLP